MYSLLTFFFNLLLTIYLINMCEFCYVHRHSHFHIHNTEICGPILAFLMCTKFVGLGI